ncbi:MAG: zinc ABC transporter substrate-binding protein ZnuA [Burkholderiales bacterium]|jgi:zinc transport system substrate-binding protein|nr:zinc ABC transporter substrate-binding protein ZnuA [Burkholderiales bacterium]
MALRNQKWQEEMMVGKKLFVAIACFLWLTTATYAAPKVVASIAPLHSLTAGVMEGIGTPDLLVQGVASPHDYSLRPSDARKLANADLVFWVGPDLEGFLEKTLHSNKMASVTLIDKVTVRLPAREGGVWDEHAHHDHDDHKHDDHKHDDHHHHHVSIDSHIWLDPINAQSIVTAIEKELIRIDASNAEKYRKNADSLRRDLAQLDRDLAQLLAQDGKKPFIVFHDAFQYFEKRYGLSGAGSITVNPEQKPSAKRLLELRERVKTSGAHCVFAEPQFDDGLVGSITEGHDVKRATLDPLGATGPLGSTAYFSMMRSLADHMHRCLSGT